MIYHTRGGVSNWGDASQDGNESFLNVFIEAQDRFWLRLGQVGAKAEGIVLWSLAVIFHIIPWLWIIFLVMHNFLSQIGSLLDPEVLNWQLTLSKLGIVEPLDCIVSLLWCLEEHIGRWSLWSISGREESESLNVSIGREEVSQFLLSALLSKVSNVELASLVGVLELHVLLVELIFAVILFDNLSDIEFATCKLDSIDFWCSIEGLNSTLSTVVSILQVLLVSRFVLDNGKGALEICVKSEIADVAKLLKKLSNFIFAPVRWEVLGIDVVEELVLGALSTRLVLACLALPSTTLSLDGFSGWLGIFEANEGSSAGGVVSIEENLELTDLTILGEEGLKHERGHLLGDFAHKDDLVGLLLHLCIIQVLVVG